MTSACERTSAVDIAAYLDDPGAPRWRDLQEHAAQCSVCGAELAAWKALRADLRSIDAHPSAQRLLAYAEARHSLAGDELKTLAAHVSECSSCRDEVSVLEALRIEPAPHPTSPRELPRPGSLAAIARMLWHPAFAYAVVAALLVHTLTSLDGTAERPMDSALRETPHAAMRAERDAGSPQVARALEAAPREAPAAASSLRQSSNGHAADEAAKAAPQAPPAGRADPASRFRGLGYLGGGASSDTDAAAKSAGPTGAARAMLDRPADSEPQPSALVRASTPYVAGGRHVVPAAERARGLDVTFLVVVAASDSAANLAPSGTVVAVPASTKNVDFHVAAADGSRELKTRIEIDDRDRSVAASIPPGWLAPGTYRVEIRAGGKNDLVAAPFELSVPAE